MSAPPTLQQLFEELLRLGHATTPQLAERLGCSPQAINARLAELAALGYGVESDPHRGHRLAHCPDLLLADELIARLRLEAGPPALLGREVFVYRQTDSTSDVIERLALEGAGEGTVVFAESQTRGRGRRGRVWLSPPGVGLWFSLLLRPPWPPAAVTRITILAAVALVEALDEMAGLAAQIKWPNDVLMGGRKIAGILTEMETDSDLVRFVTLGIGVNVHAFRLPPELQGVATSVESERGERIRRAELAVALLRRLDRLYRGARDGHFETITRQWGEHSSTLGRRVVISVGGQRLEGQAMALDENGSLLLRTDHGRIERIVGGDVILET